MQSSPEPVPIRSRAKVHRSSTYKTYIHRVVKQVHPAMLIAGATCMQLDGTTKIIAGFISERARQLARDSGKLTTTVKDVETAIRLVLPDRLATAAIHEGTKATNKFNLHEKNESGPRTKAAYAGLQFPPHMPEKTLRQQGGTVANLAPIFLAAVLEYLIAEIVLAAGTIAFESKKATIKVRHLFLAISNDKDFADLFRSTGIQLLGCGVLPYVHPSLVTDKKRRRQLDSRRKTTLDEIETRRQKYLPGTLALRKIRKCQKTYSLLLYRDPFRKFILSTISGYTDQQIRMAPSVCEYIQYYTEQCIVDLLSKTVSLMAHAKRIQVDPEDLKLAWRLMHKGVEIPAAPEDNNHAFPGPCLQRLGYRGGVKRMSKACHELLRGCAFGYINQLIHPVILLLDHHKLKTMTLSTLRNGAHFAGISLPIDAGFKRRQPKRIKSSSPTSEVEEDISLVPESESDSDFDSDVEDEPSESEEDSEEEE